MTAVVSVGGNALVRHGQTGSSAEQFHNALIPSRSIAAIAAQGWRLAIVHGNGPQVGLMLRRSELGVMAAPELKLEMCVAVCQGEVGYILQQSISNALRESESQRCAATVLTQVEVACDDPAFHHPTKPIGAFHTQLEADELMRESGWSMIEDAGRGWRRVVASPKPRAIIEVDAIRELVLGGTITICAGGGGIPVIRQDDGSLVGVPGVIDKDHASSLIARELGAELLIILTEVAQIAVDFGTIRERGLSSLSVNEAAAYLDDGQFPPGSMGPKIEAAIEFLTRGGENVLVTNFECLTKALDGNSGTWIVG